MGVRNNTTIIQHSLVLLKPHSGDLPFITLLLMLIVTRKSCTSYPPRPPGLIHPAYDPSRLYPTHSLTPSPHLIRPAHWFSAPPLPLLL
ncbi:hypothetical protein E2C01_020982 [Portunus trituberculatus]|uniref:Uncharacterized protein n=1 Tax=Portunus trituberculatus TaxID=210409 RepID=A0A5B7E215_PORTR|nr:hypothetical protein [Portunus trituberculatus]